MIPVRLCDDDIYINPPTLLFGTVDKFAQLAHKVNTYNTSASKDSRRLFGRGANWQKLPPDLIIQDELHLLLGPLGSAVSLYECAIDQLCTRKEGDLTIRPKIISSTATTRNTALQVRALYDRGISIFPKNGIDYDDSFLLSTNDAKKGRRRLVVCIKAQVYWSDANRQNTDDDTDEACCYSVCPSCNF